MLEVLVFGVLYCLVGRRRVLAALHTRRCAALGWGAVRDGAARRGVVGGTSGQDGLE